LPTTYGQLHNWERGAKQRILVTMFAITWTSLDKSLTHPVKACTPRPHCHCPHTQKMLFRSGRQ